MAAVTASVGSFDKSSSNGVTAYGTTMYFTIPENAGITGCSVTFVTHNSGGHTQDRAFSLNGARAHSSGSWASSGIALNAALLSTGQNTFRVTLKSQAGAACWWDISSITLTITYTEPSGGGGTTDPGSISINKSSLTAGESLTVSVTGASGGVYRDVYIQKMPSTANIRSIVLGHGSGAGSWAVTIPASWCETLSPDDPSFEVRIYMASYIAGGTDVGNGAKMLTVNVPSSAVPTIGTFTATRNANSVDASITNYVQNYSKVALAISGESGALGSSIASYEITGGGKSAATKTTTFGPFSQTGNITFTAKVTDSRGRTATKTVTITTLEYSAVKFSMPEAWRSSDAGVKNQRGTYARLKSDVSYSGLGGQNTVTLKGRVYIKGGTAPSWTSMAPGTAWITGGGTLLITKTYVAQMIVQDKITSTTIEFIIPTKKTGISIMAGMKGAAVGKVAEIPDIFESLWPIVAPGLSPNSNILHNGDFTNPVNQRGLTTASGAGYWLDRWTMNNTIGATYTYSTVWGLRGITTTNDIIMRQYIENPNAYAGKTVTVSFEIYSASVTASCTVRLWHNGGTLLGSSSISNGDTGIKSFTATMPSTELTDLSVVFYNYGGNDVRIKRIKLELGTVSTLHLDPPMDYGTELAKCQRFALKIERAYVAGMSYSTTRVRGAVPYVVPMRVPPTLVSIGSISACSDSDTQALTDISIFASYDTCVLIAGTGTFTAWRGRILIISDLFLSSDL